LLGPDPEKKHEMLKARTNKGIQPPGYADLTPLQLAVKGGQFPPSLLHRLIASKSGIDEMLNLSLVSLSATEVVADHLEKCDKFTVLLGAQADNVVDKMATLLFRAPSAAVRMLDLFTVEPMIADAQHCPIPCSAIMTRNSGWTKVQARYHYQRDCRECTYEDFHRDRDDGRDGEESAEELERPLQWPEWDFDSGSFQEPAWHKELVRPAGEKVSAEDGVADIKMKVCLVPNILDIDILWALARALPKDHYIFARLAVKGIVSCVWRGLIENTYALDVIWRIMELFALVVWGFSKRFLSATEDLGPQLASHSLPLCWTILLACAFRELWELSLRLFCHVRKRCQYIRDTNGESNETLRRQRSSSFSESDATQWRLLWSMRFFLFHTFFLFDACLALLLMYNLALHSGLSSASLVFGEEEATAGEVALAFNLALRFLSFTAMLRVATPLGRKIVTAMNSLLSLSMLEMFLTMTFIFMAMWCTFFVVADSSLDGPSVAIYLFRGLIVGDGDGLETLGLKPDPDHGESSASFHRTVMCVLMAASTGIFQLVVLNLIVNPVYGSEYESIQQEADLVLQRERAGYICMYLMSKRPRKSIYRALDDLCKQTFGEDVSLRLALQVAAAVLLVLGLLPPLVLHSRAALVFCALCLAAGQEVIAMTLMDSDWIGDIAAYEHSEDTSPKDARYLWICHKSSYNERWCIANDPIDRGDIEKLSSSVTEELQSLRAELAELREALPSKGK